MIKENVEAVREHIRDAALRSGREPGEITLIAVSKTKPLSDLMAAYEVGCRDFGENRVQEILEKAPHMPEDAHFHMIGHLQRNKVKQAIRYVKMIHSVDSWPLAQQIESEAAKEGRAIDILLEVNVAGEKSKYGFTPTQTLPAVREISRFTHLCIRGLMTVAPLVDDPEKNRGVFRELKKLSVDIRNQIVDNVSMDVLSMGMTGDYMVAIEEGATMVRVGTGIFGAR